MNIKIDTLKLNFTAISFLKQVAEGKVKRINLDRSGYTMDRIKPCFFAEEVNNDREAAFYDNLQTVGIVEVYTEHETEDIQSTIKTLEEELKYAKLAFKKFKAKAVKLFTTLGYDAAYCSDQEYRDFVRSVKTINSHPKEIQRLKWKTPKVTTYACIRLTDLGMKLLQDGSVTVKLVG